LEKIKTISRNSSNLGSAIGDERNVEIDKKSLEGKGRQRGLAVGGRGVGAGLEVLIGRRRLVAERGRLAERLLLVHRRRLHLVMLWFPHTTAKINEAALTAAQVERHHRRVHGDDRDQIEDQQNRRLKTGHSVINYIQLDSVYTSDALNKK
jgi:hypothetical protein